MNLTDNPRLRLLTLCALYVSQGMPFGFVTITLAAYLSNRDMDEHVIGTVGLMVSLPWAMKWCWGPIIDRFGFLPMGRRRPWILLAQMLMASTIATMIAIPDLVLGLTTLCVMVYIHNIFGSLQDVSVDALAVDLLEEEERGKANGLMYGSSYFGTFIGGACMGKLLTVFNLRTAMVVQVAILLVIMLFPLLLRERPGERLLPWTKGRSMAPQQGRSERSIDQVFGWLFKAFSLRSGLLAGVLALVVNIGTGVSVTVVVVLLIQRLGWTMGEFTDVNGGYVVWCGLAGSMAGGFLADRVGARRLAAIATVLTGIAWIGFSLAEPYWADKSFVVAFLIVQEILLAVLTVSLFALFMGVSWPMVAATQFTAYMALLNLSQGIGKALAGPLRELMSVGLVFFCIGVLQIAVVAILPWIDPRQTRRVLGDAEPQEE